MTGINERGMRMFRLLTAPFRFAFGLVHLCFDLFFGLFSGVFGLVVGLIGLMFGLFKGLLGLIVIGAVISFVAAMFNKGYRSGTRKAPAYKEQGVEESFRSYYTHGNVR